VAANQKITKVIVSSGERIGFHRTRISVYTQGMVQQVSLPVSRKWPYSVPSIHPRCDVKMCLSSATTKTTRKHVFASRSPRKKSGVSLVGPDADEPCCNMREDEEFPFLGGLARESAKRHVVDSCFSLFLPTYAFACMYNNNDDARTLNIIPSVNNNNGQLVACCMCGVHQSINDESSMMTHRQMGSRLKTTHV
jgi:hypothetical protein